MEEGAVGRRARAGGRLQAGWHVLPAPAARPASVRLPAQRRPWLPKRHHREEQRAQRIAAEGFDRFAPPVGDNKK